MIRVILCCCIVLWVLLAAAVTAADGVECELAVYQTDSSRDSAQTLLFRDTTTLVKGIRANGFLTAFSVEIEFQNIDTGQVDFTVQIVTLGPPANTYSRQFRSPYGLPARLTSIAGKNGAQYSLSVRPIRKIAVDTAGCGWVHYRKDDFKFDPSANVDIYYVPQTAGDFYWNGVKGLMEDRYRQFSEINRFNLPGKYLLYLCPCPIYSVLWDTRFGMMVDPTKSAAYAIYSTTYNAADPFLLMYASIARHYGYAPPFLLEGFAGYLSLAHFDMKDILRGKQQLPIASLLNTHTYLTSDPHIADKMSSSFVRYLIDQYKVDRFLVAYKAADDLNLAQVIESTYGKPIVQLEQDWLRYIDTVTVRPEILGAYADQAEVMFNFPMMFRYRTEQLGRVDSTRDSAFVMTEIVRANFFMAKYSDALQWQNRILAMDSTNAGLWMTRAGYEMMLGQYDAAARDLQRAQQLDTTKNPLVAFNLGLNALVRGDTTAARDILTHLVDSNQQSGGFIEARLMLATVLQHSKDAKERDRAQQLYRQVATTISQAGKVISPNASIYLWSGIAALGLGDTGNANNFLTTAVYYETRPFYTAMAYLWLGKTADTRGERDVAKENYRKVLELPAAAYHQAEAKALLAKRYVQ